jgi:hypothetical protein
MNCYLIILLIAILNFANSEFISNSSIILLDSDSFIVNTNITIINFKKNINKNDMYVIDYLSDQDLVMQSMMKSISCQFKIINLNDIKSIKEEEICNNILFDYYLKDSYNYNCKYDKNNDSLFVYTIMNMTLSDFQFKCINHDNQNKTTEIFIDSFIDLNSKQINIYFLNNTINIYEFKNYTLFNNYNMIGEFNFNNYPYFANTQNPNYIYSGPIFQKEVPFGLIKDLNNNNNIIAKFAFITHYTYWDVNINEKVYQGTFYLFEKNINEIDSFDNATSILPIDLHVNSISSSDNDPFLNKLTIKSQYGLIANQTINLSNNINCTHRPKIIYTNNIYRLSDTNKDYCSNFEIKISKDLHYYINRHNIYLNSTRKQNGILLMMNGVVNINTLQFDNKNYFYVNNIKFYKRSNQINFSLQIFSDVLNLKIKNITFLNILNNSIQNKYFIYNFNNKNIYQDKRSEINLFIEFKQPINKKNSNIQSIFLQLLSTYLITITDQENNKYQFQYHISQMEIYNFLVSNHYEQLELYYEENEEEQVEVSQNIVFYFCLCILFVNIIIIIWIAKNIYMSRNNVQVFHDYNYLQQDIVEQ